jgi:hypothetical protein
VAENPADQARVRANNLRLKRSEETVLTMKEIPKKVNRGIEYA